MAHIDIDKILDEARVLGCSDLHFTSDIAPVVRLNGALRKLSSYELLDEETIMDVAPVEIDGRTLVPLRAVSESLGVKVDWSEALQTVYLSSK